VKRPSKKKRTKKRKRLSDKKSIKKMACRKFQAKED